jgi:putative hydrolase
MANADDAPFEPFDEDDMRDAFRRFLEGGENFDPADLLKAAGIDASSADVQKMMATLGNAFGPGGLQNPAAAKDHAVAVAKEGSTPLDPATGQALTTAAGVAALWLSEVTDIAELPEAPVLATRVEWARKSFPVWEEIAQPVAISIPRAISTMMSSQAPEEIQALMGNAQGAMEQVGKSLFSLQLAQVVGKLSGEALSGGDIGIPLILGFSEYDVVAALVPQNIREFSRGLDVTTDEADIFLAVREIAHARLFRHAKWLRLHIMSAINDFASGISIDTERIMGFAEEFDPANPQALQELVSSGKLLPERTEEQTRALARLETMLALIEGWVDHVTALATTRLPKAEALGEAIRRRRASGGPAEHAFATLVGLELRPRRLREASALWQSITDAIGPSARDDLWRHPDSVPTEEDLDNPSGFIDALRNPQPSDDDMDQALRDLLDEETSS